MIAFSISNLMFVLSSVMHAKLDCGHKKHAQLDNKAHSCGLVGEKPSPESRSWNLAMRLMEAAFIWNQISARRCHNRKGNWLTSSVSHCRCAEPWPSATSHRTDVRFKRMRTCDSQALHISGPVGLEPLGSGRKSTQTIHHSEAATDAADVLGGRRLTAGTAGLHRTPSTSLCCGVVMESSTNMAGNWGKSSG